jgi:hypothetical protein
MWYRRINNQMFSRSDLILTNLPISIPTYLTKTSIFDHGSVLTSADQIRERTHSTMKGNMQGSEESLIQYYALREEHLATCFPLDDEVPPYPLPQRPHNRRRKSFQLGRSSSINTFSPLTSVLCTFTVSHHRCLLQTNWLKNLPPITLKLVGRISTLSTI